MIPVLALLGRPNVGKSTLFNRLSKSRDALVSNFSGLTRDRLYGQGRFGPTPYLLIDTGGIEKQDSVIRELVAEQTTIAIAEADQLLFLVDGQQGLCAMDLEIANRLRRSGKSIHLLINKIDHRDPHQLNAEFAALGLGQPLLIAAASGRGLHQMMAHILPTAADNSPDDNKDDALAIAIIGKPNAGKSTLVNALSDSERLITSAVPGTTRDSISVPIQRGKQHYLLVDTAGLRRRSKVDSTVERFSAIKALQSLAMSQCAILLIDGVEGITLQDRQLLAHIIESGRSLLLAINKNDQLGRQHRQQIRQELEDSEARHYPWYFVSAQRRQGLANLLSSAEKGYRQAGSTLSTGLLNRLLAAAVRQHPPPLAKGLRPRLRYIHQGGRQPPVIVIHGARAESLPSHYQRYLHHYLRHQCKLYGTPLRLHFKNTVDRHKAPKPSAATSLRVR